MRENERERRRAQARGAQRGERALHAAVAVARGGRELVALAGGGGQQVAVERHLDHLLRRDRHALGELVLPVVEERHGEQVGRQTLLAAGLLAAAAAIRARTSARVAAQQRHNGRERRPDTQVDTACRSDTTRYDTITACLYCTVFMYYSIAGKKVHTDRASASA